MCYGLPKRTLSLASFFIHMNPLEIICSCGKLIDSLLGEFYPLADSKLFPYISSKIFV